MEGLGLHPAFLPPAGAADPAALERLRACLGSGDGEGAEAAWERILAAMRPLGAEGRRQLAEAFEACAALKARLGKTEEARRLRQRAASARKDPGQLRLKPAGAAPALAARRPDPEGPDEGRQRRIEAARAELEALLRVQERRKRAWAIAIAASLLAALLALAGPLAAGLAGPLALEERRQGDRIEVWGHNSDPDAVRWAWVELAGQVNVRSDTGLPRGFVLRPLDRRLLFTLGPQDPDRGFSYALRTRTGEGDPQQEPDPRAVYLLPFAHGTKHSVSQGYFGRATHAGLHALDFDMPEGTPVHAARAGVVIRVKQDGARGGQMLGDAADGNVVQVLHDDATWAVYAHLRHRGAAVQKGQRVKAGDLIGHSGATGLASGPHLHFAVYRASWEGPRTLPTLFRTAPEPVPPASLEEGRSYYAYHPGGAPFEAVLGEALREEDYRGLTRTATGGRLTLREERVDRRNIVWAVNGTDRALELSVDLERPVGARASVGLPHRTQVPARTEAFLFFVDFVGEGPSSYRLKASYRPLQARP